MKFLSSGVNRYINIHKCKTCVFTSTLYNTSTCVRWMHLTENQQQRGFRATNVIPINVAICCVRKSVLQHLAVFLFFFLSRNALLISSEFNRLGRKNNLARITEESARETIRTIVPNLYVSAADPFDSGLIARSRFPLIAHLSRSRTRAQGYTRGV